MPSFADLIAENYYSETSLTWKLNGPTCAVAEFSVEALKVEVSFEQREDRGPWHVAFNVIRGDAVEGVVQSFRIFNGVFQAVREFVETREPPLVVFITKRDALAGIYETYLRRERSVIESLGYTVEGPDRVDPYTQYTLRRVRPSEWRG